MSTNAPAHRRRGSKLPSQSLTVEELLAEASAAVRSSVPKNTARAYQADWNDFRAWCARRKVKSLPADAATVSAYLWAKAKTHKTGTVGRRLTTIGFVHSVRGLPDPRLSEEVKKVWQAIRRKKGWEQRGKKPLLTDAVKRIISSLPPGLKGARDKALILIGFAGALRRSEVVALCFEDLELTEDGLLLYIRRSKTDQEAHGDTISLPYGQNRTTCPVRAVLEWMTLAKIEKGPVFRKVNKSGRVEDRPMNSGSVSPLLKAGIRAAGMRPDKYGAHSLRSGLATSAAAAGVEERHLQSHTRHKSLTILRRYIKEGTAFKNSPAGKVGL